MTAEQRAAAQAKRLRERAAARYDLLQRRELLLASSSADVQAGYRWVWAKHAHLSEGEQKQLALAFASGRRSERLAAARKRRAEAE